jgi:hypothetical protein
MFARRLLPYGPRLVNILNTELPHDVIRENGRVGGEPPGHLAEATVQHLIARLLIPHLPSPELLRNNKEALNHPQLGRCIPDIIIDRIGGAPWGYFELKTLLEEDQLSDDKVEHDIEKLCAYKAAHPDAAAIFLLAASRKKLFPKDTKNNWEKAGLRADLQAFKAKKLVPQNLANRSYIAIPCGWSGMNNKVVTLAWEIQPADKVQIQSATYQFIACMAGTASWILHW